MDKYSDKCTDNDRAEARIRERELSLAGTIKNIARASRSIVRDADAQGITTEDEVEGIVTELLFNDESRSSIVRDALSRAREILYLRFRRRGGDSYSDGLEALFNARLELLVDVGADWAPLNCFVCDGQEAYENVKEAVRAGLVDNFALEILGDAQEKYYNGDEED